MKKPIFAPQSIIKHMKSLKTLIAALFCLFCLASAAQAQEPSIDSSRMVEKMPAFPGGEEGLMDFIGTNVRYPQYAIDHGISGRVFVGFVVETDGSISNIEVLRGIGGGCDEEAVRVVKLMPNWIPGEAFGKKVRVKYILPISFKFTQDLQP